ncbi:hypothetical protein MY10362_002126 [Beauveria mimosiformis]
MDNLLYLYGVILKRLHVLPVYHYWYARIAIPLPLISAPPIAGSPAPRALNTFLAPTSFVVRNPGDTLQTLTPSSFYF